MTTATLNIRLSPRRILSRQEAADYCGLPPRHFEMICPCRPIEISHRRKGWDIADLDRWLDSIKNCDTHEPDSILARLGA